MSNLNDRVKAPPAPAPQSFADKVRAKIDALKSRGPKPRDLGDGAASEAARALGGRKKQIDDAVDAATR